MKGRMLAVIDSRDYHFALGGGDFFAQECAGSRSKREKASVVPRPEIVEQERRESLHS